MRASGEITLAGGTNMSKRRTSNRSTRKRAAARWPWVAAIGALVAISAAFFWLSSSSIPEDADVVVYKTPTCGCCSKWVDHLRASELEVTVVNVRSTRAIQSRVGVPRELGSCHTAKVGDYWVEGHVPADLVERLVSERPDDIQGIAVPGMPIGSPCMEGPDPVEYDVIAYGKDGQARIYATRQGEAEPQ